MTDGQKLEEVRRLTGLTWKEMAKRANIKSAQTFTDIRNGRHGISVKLAGKLTAAFPLLRREWLLFESGAMTTGAQPGAIGLYSSTDDLATEGNAETLNLGSMFPGATAAVRNASEAMTEYPVGCILVLKGLPSDAALIPGANYLFQTKDYSLVKRMQQGEKEGFISLYSTNEATYPDGKQIYEPFSLERSAIVKAFAILGYIMPHLSETLPTRQ